jgi:hypothetical protein
MWNISQLSRSPGTGMAFIKHWLKVSSVKKFEVFFNCGSAHLGRTFYIPFLFNPVLISIGSNFDDSDVK